MFDKKVVNAIISLLLSIVIFIGNLDTLSKTVVQSRVHVFFYCTKEIRLSLVFVINILNHQHNLCPPHKFLE